MSVRYRTTNRGGKRAVSSVYATGLDGVVINVPRQMGRVMCYAPRQMGRVCLRFQQGR